MQIKLSGNSRRIAEHGFPFSLNFTVSARVHGRFTQEALAQALARLRLCHPLLASRIEANAAGDVYFTTENVPAIPLRIVERTHENDWVAEVECELPQPYDHRIGPLLRCIWLRSHDTEVSDLILVCDHLTADGRACIHALRDLLTLLANPGLTLEPQIPTHLGQLIPEAVLPHLEKVIAEALKNAPPPQPGGFRPRVSADPLRVLPFALSTEETATLMARCKAEKVTVQAALCAAFLAPFAEKHPEEPIRWVESPMDIRKRLSQSMEHVYGNYISLLFTQLDCSPSRSLWDIARDAARDLADTNDKRLFSVPLILMTVAKEPLPMPAVTINYDLSISNLGRLNIPAQYGSLQLESVYAPTFNASQAGHRVLGVSTFNGQLRATFTSCDPAAPGLLQRASQFLCEMIRA